MGLSDIYDPDFTFQNLNSPHGNHRGMPLAVEEIDHTYQYGGDLTRSPVTSVLYVSVPSDIPNTRQ